MAKKQVAQVQVEPNEPHFSLTAVLDFYRARQNARKVPDLEPITELDQIKKGDWLFKPDGNRFEVVEIDEFWGRDIYVYITQGIYCAGSYDTTKRKLNYRESSFARVGKTHQVERMVNLRLDQDSVYRILH